MDDADGAHEESAALTAATSSAKDMEKVSKAMYKAACEAAAKSAEVLSSLESCKAEVAEMAEALVKIMKDLNTAGENLKKSSETLHCNWTSYKKSLKECIKTGKLSSRYIEFCVNKLKEMLTSGKKCDEFSLKLSEKVAEAVKQCISLRDRCEQASGENAMAASNTRWVGYSSTTFLSIVTGFLLFATSSPFVLIIGAGAGAVATGFGTKVISSKQDTAAEKFKQSMDKLEDSVKTLTKSSEDLKKFKQFSSEFCNNLETALRTKAAYKKEMDEKDARIRELEAQNESERLENERKDARIRELEAQKESERQENERNDTRIRELEAQKESERQ